MDTGVYRVDKVIVDALKGAGFKRVTFGDINDTDLNKQGIMPLAHLTMSSNIQTSRTLTFNYEIAILDLVDENSDDPRDSFNQMSLTNNIEDVLHDLSFMFNRAWQGIKKNANNIVELPDSVTLTPGYAELQNKLAGYTISFTITIPNTGLC